MNARIDVICKTDVQSHNGALIFECGKVYESFILHNLLLVKDEGGCIRTISSSKTGHWNDDKFFVKHFIQQIS